MLQAKKYHLMLVTAQNKNLEGNRIELSNGLIRYFLSKGFICFVTSFSGSGRCGGSC